MISDMNTRAKDATNNYCFDFIGGVPQKDDRPSFAWGSPADVEGADEEANHFEMPDETIVSRVSNLDYVPSNATETLAFSQVQIFSKSEVYDPKVNHFKINKPSRPSIFESAGNQSQSTFDSSMN